MYQCTQGLGRRLCVWTGGFRLCPSVIPPCTNCELRNSTCVPHCLDYFIFVLFFSLYRIPQGAVPQDLRAVQRSLLQTFFPHNLGKQSNFTEFKKWYHSVQEKKFYNLSNKSACKFGTIFVILGRIEMLRAACPVHCRPSLPDIIEVSVI